MKEYDTIPSNHPIVVATLVVEFFFVSFALPQPYFRFRYFNIVDRGKYQCFLSIFDICSVLPVNVTRRSQNLESCSNNFHHLLLAG